jgi:1-phosphofructokinase family hexose kinase
MGAAAVVVAVIAPSLDRFYTVKSLTPGAINRPTTVSLRAGGKGFNVAAVARRLHAGPVLAVAPLGGVSGRWLADMAEAEGIDVRSSGIRAELRSCLSVWSEADRRLTEFYEPATDIDAGEWPAYLDEFRRTIADGPSVGVALISGSLAPRVPDDGLALLVESARDAGILTLLDSHGRGVEQAVKARPDVLKVNDGEAAELTGAPVTDEREAVVAARALQALGVGSVVITLGPVGAVATIGSAAMRFTPPHANGRYPVGSGDALLAGMGASLAGGGSIADAIRLGIAAAVANAEIPVAGMLDSARVRELLPMVNAESLDAAGRASAS